MKVYKILHKPTGLFFTPSRGMGNLSKVGKLYPKMPSLKWVECIRLVVGWSNKLSERDLAIIRYFSLNADERTGGYYIDTYVNPPIEEWEIIEIE
jgi:hypothetical protein